MADRAAIEAELLRLHALGWTVRTTAEETALARRMKANGETAATICQTLGIGRTTLYRYRGESDDDTDVSSGDRTPGRRDEPAGRAGPWPLGLVVVKRARRASARRISGKSGLTLELTWQALGSW